MKFECPHCRQHLKAEEEHLGTQVGCPSCGEKINVPDNSRNTAEPNIKGKAAPTPPPLPKPPAPWTELSEEDSHHMWGLRGAMLAMPLYMLALLFLIIGLWDSIGMKMNPALIKFAIPMLIVLGGISLRSWQSIAWMKTDPYRASAMGKKLFLIFLVLATLDTVISEFPTARFEGPLEAIRTEQVNYLWSTKTLYVVDPDKTVTYEPNLIWFLGYLFTVAHQLIEHIAIYAFIALLYNRLRQGRVEFNWDHFLYEVSWGKYGAKYNWSEQGACTQPSVAKAPSGE